MITGKLVGDTAMMVRFQQMPAAVHRRVIEAITRSAIELEGKVARDKLDGQVLKARTGQLAASVHHAVRVDGTSVRGFVGTNLEYGRHWEYGFDRRVGAGARGGPKGLFGRSLASYVAKHPPGQKHYAARSFLRTSLAESEPAIFKRIEAALAAAKL
jgi:hypothetical protein